MPILSRRNLLFGAATASALTQLRAQNRPGPNIVVFFSDDMGASQIGFNGGKEVKTPHIDKIAHEGVKLTQFYVQPVCTPSRSCLLTGRYAWKTGTEVRPTANARWGMLRDERTLAEALREAGYATWITGKWHLGEWQSHHLPLARGFDHHYGHYSAAIDSFTHRRDRVLDWHRNGKPVVEQGYSSFLLAQEASKLISGHDRKRPFFLYVPFNAVHAPHMAPPEYVKKYAHLGRNAAQRAQLECMDIAVGQVMRTIQEKGFDDNTLVMFTNDNGGPELNSNLPYPGEKSSYREGGVRVPAALRWPGKIRPGSASNEMIHIVDLMPTFCGLAGARAETKLPIDGKDVWKSIASGDPSPRTEIVHSLQVIRQGDWKLIEQGATYYNWPEQPLQLYNIRQDPYEKANVAAAHPDIVTRLRSRLTYHRQFAREMEPKEPIPDFPPAVYGEEENRLYGASLRDQLGSAPQPARIRKNARK